MITEQLARSSKGLLQYEPPGLPYSGYNILGSKQLPKRQNNP